MPKSKGGKKALQNFQKEYGDKEGKSIAYATANKRGGGLYQALHGKSKSSSKGKKKR